MLGILNGYDLVESLFMVDTIQIQKRKHKKRRINKKWAKRYGYTYITKPKTNVFIYENKIIGHPETVKLIKLELANQT